MRRRFTPNPAALPVHNTIHYRKSHAAAFNLISWSQGLKHFEHLVDIFLWDSRTIVSYRKQVVIVMPLGGYCDGPVCCGMMFDGIRDEVAQNLLQRPTVCTSV